MPSTVSTPASTRPDRPPTRPRFAGIPLLSAFAIFAGISLLASVGVVIGTPGPAGALATFGPISDLSLSNSTISESANAYQLRATDVSGTTTSTQLTAQFATGSAT